MMQAYRLSRFCVVVGWGDQPTVEKSQRMRYSDFAELVLYCIQQINKEDAV